MNNLDRGLRLLSPRKWGNMFSPVLACVLFSFSVLSQSFKCYFLYSCAVADTISADMTRRAVSLR